ncbi:hypothetical protein TorRG33x02_311190 [Trema orientale]|uniref:Uncharacterized protein n=1 Tax=Trema orientale TaxID=63057 RepID=A0A2P5BRM5_TREOI|nr:hypothetical protein TorRG33x02_311190 [Trema orientale]
MFTIFPIPQVNMVLFFLETTMFYYLKEVLLIIDVVLLTSEL